MSFAKTVRKALVIGIDGLDPNLCRALAGQGKLPHLSRLAEVGTFADLATVNPAQSPVAWTCLATGTNPGAHGVYDFIVRDPATYLPRLSLTRPGPGGTPAPAYDTPTFFDVASGAGLPVTAVRWPVTYPPAFAGAKVLSGLGAPDVKGRLGNYVHYVEVLPAGGGAGRGRVEQVRFADVRARIAIEGPMAIVAGKRSMARTEMALTRQDGRLHYAVGEQHGELAPGEWSPYLTLSFPLADGRLVTGVTRLFCGRLEPLELYCGPVQVDPRAPNLPVASPEGYAAELAAALGGPYSTLGMPEETKGLTDGVVTDEAFLAFCDDVTAEREAMLEHELGRFTEGLLSVVFDTSDRIQHCFWRYHDPSHPLFDPAAAARLGPVIENHLVRMDAMVGRVVEAAGDDTALFVCSDHGFCSYARSFDANAWLAQAGYLKLKPHDPADNGELFKYVDWSGTRAYALGFGSIYCNLAGRERSGIVAPGQPARDLADEIAARLTRLDDGGRPAVAAVHRKEAIYSGEKFAAAPDLVVGLRPPYRMAWTAAIGGASAAVFTDNRQKWSGDHCVDASFVPGALFSNLPLPGAAGGVVSQTRLAATVCHVLGLAPADGMEPDLVGGGERP
ncbi:alkaline phosphatase family protein [Desulfovibrio sp. JY]|nr:alkaline phosphatase family protein [Desulfovibrio sp. JY]